MENGSQVQSESQAVGVSQFLGQGERLTTHRQGLLGIAQ
jgi:hypothetical protein